MDENIYWSRLSGFFEKSIKERRDQLIKIHQLNISSDDLLELDQGFSLKNADLISENVIGLFSLPLSVAPNFLIDKKAVIVPMVTEEPSVVAAASKMAKIVGMAGGFTTEISKSLMKGQIQLYGFLDTDKLISKLNGLKNELMDFSHNLLSSLKKRGGGIKDINFRPIDAARKDLGPMFLIEPIIDVVDAMGANIVNTFLENLSLHIKSRIEANIGIRILSNLADLRIAKAHCSIPVKLLACSDHFSNGHEVAKRMLLAHSLAESDHYRAATQNKGILNGIDAVALATGNDFRAIEAGAHAYASREGCYKPLTSIDLKNKSLHAELIMPIACGVVGGITSIHAHAKFSLRILGSFGKSAQGLSSVMVSVGLAQCLSAILALSTEGIQKGHIKLHERKKEKHS